MDESFTAAHRRILPVLKAMAHTQRVPGMTTQEVVVEMESVLWKAWTTYDHPRTARELGANITVVPVRSRTAPRMSFDQWWRLVWTTHRIKLIQSYYRVKRQRLREATVTGKAYDDAVNQIASDTTVAFGGHVIPPCPSNDPTTRKVWDMIARGYLFNEIQQELRMGRKPFDTIIRSLRGDAVRAVLVA